MAEKGALKAEVALQALPEALESLKTLAKDVSSVTKGIQALISTIVRLDSTNGAKAFKDTEQAAKGAAAGIKQAEREMSAFEKAFRKFDSENLDTKKFFSNTVGFDRESLQNLKRATAETERYAQAAASIKRDLNAALQGKGQRAEATRWLNWSGREGTLLEQIRKAEAEGLLKISRSGVQFLDERAYSELGLSKKQSAALRNQQLDTGLFDKSFANSKNRTEDFKNALTTLGGTLGTTNEKFRSWAPTLGRVDAALNTIKLRGGAFEEIAAGANRATLTQALLTRDLSLTSGAFKANTTAGLNALGVTRSLAEANGLLSAQFLRAEKAASAVTNVVSPLQAGMEKLSGAVKNTATYFTAFLGVQAVIGTFSGAVGAVAKFDQALANLTSITQSSKAEIGLLGNEIKSVMVSSRLGMDEITKGATTIAQAGFTAADTTKVLAASATLATGSLSTMDSTADLVTTTIESFGMEASKAGKISDIFAVAINKSKLSLESLRTVFNYIGPLAKQAGMDLEDTAASAMILKDAGLKDSTAATGLRNVIQHLLQPNPALLKLARNAEIPIDMFNPMKEEAGGLANVIDRLSGVIKNADDAFAVFGTRGAPAALALIAKGKEGFEEARSALGEYGAASKMASDQMEGLVAKVQNLGNKLQVLAINMSENGGLSSVLKGIVTTGQFVVDIFLKLDSSTKGLSSTFMLAATAGLAFNGFLVRMAANMVPFVAGALSASRALNALMAFFVMNPYLAFAAAITALVGVFKLFGESLDRQIEKHKQNAAGLKESVTELQDFVATASTADQTTASFQSQLAGLIEKYPQLASAISVTNGQLTANIDKLRQATQATRELFLLENKAAIEKSEIQQKQMQQKIDSITTGFAEGVGYEKDVKSLSADEQLEVAKLQKDIALSIKSVKDMKEASAIVGGTPEGLAILDKRAAQKRQLEEASIASRRKELEDRAKAQMGEKNWDKTSQENKIKLLLDLAQDSPDWLAKANAAGLSPKEAAEFAETKQKENFATTLKGIVKQAITKRVQDIDEEMNANLQKLADEGGSGPAVEARKQAIKKKAAEQKKQAIKEVGEGFSADDPTIQKALNEASAAAAKATFSENAADAAAGKFGAKVEDQRLKNLERDIQLRKAAIEGDMTLTEEERQLKIVQEEIEGYRQLIALRKELESSAGDAKQKQQFIGETKELELKLQKAINEQLVKAYEAEKSRRDMAMERMRITHDLEMENARASGVQGEAFAKLGLDKVRSEYNLGMQNAEFNWGVAASKFSEGTIEREKAYNDYMRQRVTLMSMLLDATRMYNQERWKYATDDYRSGAIDKDDYLSRVRDARSSGILTDREANRLERQEGGLFSAMGVGVDRAREQVQSFGEFTAEVTSRIGDTISSNLTGAWFDFIDGTKSATDAMADFGRSTLRWLAEVLMKQALLNMIVGQKGSPGLMGALGTLGSGLMNMFGGAAVHHTGGVVGSGRVIRQGFALPSTVPVRRYHSGGTVLGADEVPAILQKGERVIPKGETEGGFSIGSLSINVNASGGTPTQNKDLAEQVGKSVTQTMRAVVAEELAKRDRVARYMG